MIIESLGKLKPSFKKVEHIHLPTPTGLTDGATSCIISSELKAEKLEIKPLSYIVDSVFIGTDPYNEMLLGPAYAIPKLLKNNITLKDIDVFEIHEVFAGQILANINAINDDKFCRKF